MEGAVADPVRFSGASPRPPWRRAAPIETTSSARYESPRELHPFVDALVDLLVAELRARPTSST